MKNRLRCFMAKAAAAILFLCVTQTPSFSQHLIFGDEKQSLEVGVTFGPSFFLGDLGGNRGIGKRFIKDLNLELTKLMKGAFITYNPNEWLGIKFSAGYTYLEGKDEIIQNNGGQELWRKQRNLDFKSDVWEASVAVEFCPTAYLLRNSDNETRLRPYFFAGIGAFHFNPKGSLTDDEGNKRWYELKPLRTEGQGMLEYPQRKEYKLTQVNMPMGAGLKYFLSPKLSVGVEVSYRKTYTDYIDDVSTKYIDSKYFYRYLSEENADIAKQIYAKVDKTYFRGTVDNPGDKRGNSNNMDTYFSVGLKIGVRIGHGVSDGDGEGFSIFRFRNRGSVACPVRF
ncbi:DUF6089 family protein [Ferruginibacter lapsinanis]|uniref:DUF6089 family protein n=1 Tax=Ferruginibacter lapsinanis TaxID=563172 RepID=UPI001E5D0E57|nr:DUF6089 family protein [Ferruginibacter lapsinanis]UEG50197.1 DUF6089 family protein [Ferruginibacter lapsinanis]